MIAPMWTCLSQRERWALFVVALVVLGSIAGRTWLRSRPPAPLPADLNPAVTTR